MNKVQRIIQLHNNVRENSGMGDAAYGCGATLDARSYYAAAESATDVVASSVIRLTTSTVPATVGAGSVFVEYVIPQY